MRSPKDYIDWLDSEIEKYNKLRYLSEDDVSKFQFMGSASALIDARNSFITIQFPSQEEDNNFANGLD